MAKEREYAKCVKKAARRHRFYMDGYINNKDALAFCSTLQMRQLWAVSFKEESQMDEIDVIAIGSMPAHEREVAMGKMFEKLMEMPESEQMSAFEALIGQMAEKGTDEQYRNLCLTNLKLAAGLPDSALKPFLMMRMKAASHLSPPLAQRDMKMLQEALEQSDPAIKEKIAQNM